MLATTLAPSRILRITGLLISISLAGACNDAATTKDTSSSVVSVELALNHAVDSPSCPHSFGAPDVRSIRLRILDGPVADLDNASAVFDTSSPSIAPDGCLSFEQCTSSAVAMDGTSDLSWEERAAACVEAQGQLIPATTIQVTDLIAHDDMTAVIEAFADDACSERIFMGVRGGINVGLGDDAPYHITPLCVGHFTALPHPSSGEFDFVRSVAQTSCERDCDCIDAFKTSLGVQCTDAQKENTSVSGAPIACESGQCTTKHGFESLLITECTEDEDCLASYPHSACNNGNCEPTSYYPLNTRHPRAFHSAIETPEGQIVLAGGLARANEGVYTAIAIEPVTFDPQRMLFHAMPFEFDEDTGANHVGRAFAHARIATTSNGSPVGMAMSGGFQSVNISVTAEEGVSLAVPTSGPGGGDNLRSTLLTMRTEANKTLAAVHPLSVIVNGEDEEQAIAMQTGEMVPNDNPETDEQSTQHIHVGGIVPGDSPAAAGIQDDASVSYGNVAINCVFGKNADSGPSANCKGSRNVFLNARAGATTACFERRESDGACSQFAILGGAQAGDARVGEVFRRKTKANGTTVDSFDPLDSDAPTPLNQAKFVTAHVTGPGEVTVFGGTSGPGFGAPANVPTQALTLSGYDDPENNPELLSLEADSSALGAGAAATYRSHHASASLPGNRVLVTGGLNANNQSTSSALIYDAAAHAYVESAIEMAHPRFGHSATAITHGPLKGAVLISGGLHLVPGSEHPEFVPGAEIFIPATPAD